MNKGIVMEKKAKTLIVMTGDGQFREIARKNRSCLVGEEVAFAPSEARERDRLTPFSMLSSLAAAILICVVLFGGLSDVGSPSSWFAGRSVVAYVSLDINPSVELGVDKMEKVRSLSALNDDGEALIEGVVFKDKPLDEVMQALLVQSEGDYLSSGAADIMITATTVKDSRLVDSRLTEELESTVKAYLDKNHAGEVENFAVTALPTTPEVRNEAKKVDLSAGKYAAYLGAKNNGYAVTVDELKAQSLRKLAEPAGGIASYINKDQLTKENLQSLLEEEKTGELDRKLKNKQDKGESGEAKATPVPSVEDDHTPVSVITTELDNGKGNAWNGNSPGNGKNNGNSNGNSAGNGNGNSKNNGKSNGKGNGKSSNGKGGVAATPFEPAKSSQPSRGQTENASKDNGDQNTGQKDDGQQGSDPKNGDGIDDGKQDDNGSDSGKKDNSGKGNNDNGGDQKDNGNGHENDSGNGNGNGKSDGDKDKNKDKDKDKDGDQGGEDGSWLGIP